MAYAYSRVDYLVALSTSNAVPTWAQADAAYAQALLAMSGGDSEVSAIYAQVAIRMDATPDGTPINAAGSTDAEDSDVIYHNIIFPMCIAYGSTGVPRYMTTRVEVQSGAEQRNARWEYPKHEYNIVLDKLPADEISEIMNIWHVCKGSHIGFLFLDPMDHTSSNTTASISGTDVTPTDQFIALAVGSQDSYPIYKFYEKNGHAQRRRIRYPKEGTLLVAIDGFECTNWTYSYSTNELTFILNYGPTTSNLSKSGALITGANFSDLNPGDLVYVDGWSDPSYNYPEGGDPLRVVSADSTSLVLQKYDGTDYGPANFSTENVTIKSALPTSGAELTCGYYFYVPVRFEDDDVMESEIDNGLRESAQATFDSIVLREVFE